MNGRVRCTVFPHTQFVLTMLAVPLTMVVGCGGASGGSTPPPATTYTIGGTVSGLTGTGLVLQNNGGNNLAVSASGSFTFSTAVTSGTAYNVTVLTQPAAQNCTVTNGSGTASANVTNVQVTCSTLPPTTYAIGGTISGLTGTGLVLQNNGGNNLAVSASGSFTFSAAVASGSTYSVTVLTQPTGQNCTVTNGSGSASANVTNVQVACSNLPPTTFTIGGTISGLTGTGLVLQNNGGNNLAASASGSFTFSAAVTSGVAYSVTVLTQPAGQSCTVTGGSGTASTNVTNVQVTCSTTTYTIGGTISGLTASSLVLADGSQTVSPVSGATSFAFPTAVASGSSYAVTVKTQPSGETCMVTNGSGTASANVTNIQVTCTTTTYTIGGTAAGLTGTGLVLFNGSNGDRLPVSSNGSFTFGVTEPGGSSYNVTVLMQPTGQNCTVTNGSGTVSANVTNIQVTCTTNTYTIGGTVSGLTGTGLVLQDNGGNNLVVSASGSFTFSTAVTSGAAYNVAVLTQPAGQSCTVTNGNGTASANVANVQVTCSIAYTIGGTVSGLIGTGLVLQDNGGNNLAVSASGSFTFSNSVAIGSTYSVTVLTQPSSPLQSCTVANGSGTANARISNVQVTCSTTTYTIGGTVSGLTGTGLVLQNNGGNNLAVSASGSFTFSAAVASGTIYSVTVLTQPIGQSCTVTNGSGTASANVTNVQVSCVGEWTWMGGSNTVGIERAQSGVYGTLGTAASTNTPGGRESSMTWSDASGNLWLFGGTGYNSTGITWTSAYPTFNDLWKFDPKLGTYGEWTWMGGSDIATQPGVYGTQGTAASTNIPGARSSAVTWSDASGNLWLYGGICGNCIDAGEVLSDLWKFSPALGTYGEWTWMGGSSTVNRPAVYGTQGTADPSYTPGSLSGAVSWSDASGNLWLFGGGLWKFDPKLGTYGEWARMGGSSTGVYGTLGTAASTNIPGARSSAVSWSDASGNLWLFGGYGLDSTGAGGYLNDLWKFDPSSGTYGEWTWMGGSDVANQSGAYGPLGTAASTNIPRAREWAVSWSDASGNLWLFGGNGYDSTGANGLEYLNDLWKFDPSLGTYGEWALMGGSDVANQSGVYGRLGTAASTNIPGARISAVSWSDALGNLWLFGGNGLDSAGVNGWLNDLWEYQSNLPSTTYTIGGTVSGLTGTGLVLQDNGDNNLAVGASGSFTFSAAVASGTTYSVTVLTQPTGQSCTVTNGSGTASANVTNVQVTCSTTTYTIGGTVAGLTGTGLVLQDNGGYYGWPVNANGAFTLDSVSGGVSYNVTVLTQPTGQICTVTNGSGTANANVTNVQVSCGNSYSIGGTVSGLTGTGMVLQDNGGNSLQVSANGSFTFSTAVASGAPYIVTVSSQPAYQNCTVTNGTGTASANVTNVQVACSNITYTIGGGVSGLTGTGLILQNNGANNLAISANGAFTFSKGVAVGSTYSVTVLTEPTGQNCTVTNGSGPAIGNVLNVQVACVNVNYTIGGTVSGLTGTGLVLQDNSGNNLALSASGTFAFSNSIPGGSTYSVTVLTQPTGQNCTVINGSGTAAANVTNVQVACSTAYYTVGGTVSGLTGTGLVLLNNGNLHLPVSANGTFTFNGQYVTGTQYSVTVLTQPIGQSCTVTNGSGTASANVTNVQVTCSTAYYTVGGTVSGLTGTTGNGVILQDGDGNGTEVLANGAFTFFANYAYGETYNVTVSSQPTGQICTVNNGSGTVSANVTNVLVTCTP